MLIKDDKFEQKPFEIIKKEKKNDLNIKCSKSTVIEKDMRISFNIEHKFPQLDERAKPVTIRFKERTSFRIGWMRIDLTMVQSGTQVEYECELEIEDVNFVSRFKDDVMAMRKLARKFMLNCICLSKMITQIIA